MEPLKTVWTDTWRIVCLLATEERSCRYEEESFPSWCRSWKCCFGRVQMLCCSLVLSPEQPVQSGPKSSNYKQCGLVPERRLALNVPNSVSTHILAFVVLRGSHLSSKVLLCGCCSVTCVCVPAGSLQSHTSNCGDVMEENTVWGGERTLQRSLQQSSSVWLFGGRGTDWSLCLLYHQFLTLITSSFKWSSRIWIKTSHWVPPWQDWVLQSEKKTWL